MNSSTFAQVMAQDFETVEVRAKREGAPAWTVRGDDVYGLSLWARLPEEAPSGTRLARSLSSVAALWPRPEAPAGFAGEDDFVAWLERREHLGALAVIEPCLELDDDGKPLAVRLRRLRSRWARGFVAGQGSPTVVPDGGSVDVTFADRGVRVVAYRRFALPSPIEADGRWAPESMLALGWLSVTMDLRVDGSSEVHLASSFVPSARFYREGQLCARHEMSRCRPRELDATLTPTPEVPSGTTWRRFSTQGYVHARR